MLLPDLIVAEVVHVLESFHEVPAHEIAGLVCSVIAFAPIRTLDPALLLRSLAVYETHRIDFAEEVGTRIEALLVPQGDRLTFSAGRVFGLQLPEPPALKLSRPRTTAEMAIE